MNHILYQIFKIILGKSLKMQNTKNSPRQIYITKNENKISFKIETEYYLELLTLESNELLGRTEKK